MARHLILSAIALLILVSCNKREQEKQLVIEYNPAESVHEILPVEDTLVKPVIYTNTLSFQDLEHDVKKEKFIAYILPSILIEKYELENILEKVTRMDEKAKSGIELDSTELNYLRTQLTDYKATTVEDLKEKLQVHPVSLIIAQAALETGWGTSRIYEDGNNLFGMYGYRRMLTLDPDHVVKHYKLKKYLTIAESVEDYIKNIAKSRAYKKFRKERARSEDPVHLIKFLSRYSVNDQYAYLLKQIIRKNKLGQYDKCVIHPDSFVEKIEPKPLFAGIPLY
jgi:Bax protein